jgi:carbamoyl-phosphate synthase large subunit
MIERAVVTGGAGVIGRVLVRMLEDEGIPVLSIDRQDQDDRPGVENLQMDLEFMTPELIASFDPTHIFHLAASFERSDEQPSFWDENHRDNVVASAVTLRAALACKHLKRYVFASSYLVYDPSLYLKAAAPEVARLLKEGDRLDPRNVCGAAKLLHEREVELAAAGRFGICNARIFRVYGRGSRDVVSRWVRSAIQGETIELFDSGGMFDYIFADDAADGLLRLGKSEAEGVVNLGSGAPRSVATVLECIAEATDGVTVVDHGRSERLIEASGAEVSLLQSRTGWVPPTKLELGVADLVEFERSEQKAASPDLRTHPRQPLKVLLPSAGGKVSLVRALQQAQRALAMDPHVTVADQHEDCLAGLVADRVLTEPTIDEASDAALVEWAISTGANVVVPCRDAELARWAGVSETLAQLGVAVIVAPVRALEICTDKLRFAQWTEEMGIPHIPTSTDLAEVMGTSFVVKERRGSGSRETFIDVDRATAAAVSSKLDEPLFQPYISGSELSADFFIASDGCIHGPIVRERTRVVGGESVDTRVLDVPAVLMQLVERLSENIGFRGPGCAQVIREPGGGIHCMEVNARFGGASAAATVAGVNLAELALRGVLGEPQRSSTPGRRVRLVRLSRDLVLPE